MPNFDLSASTTNAVTLANVKVNGINVDSDLITPVRLDIGSGGAGNVLQLRIDQSFDEQSWIKWGDLITLSVESEASPYISTDSIQYFIGPLINHQPEYADGSDHFTVNIPDVTWIVDGDFIEFDVHGLTPGETIERIFSGDLSDGNFDAKVDDQYLQLASDPGILGKKLESYQFAGMPVYQAIQEIIAQAGNFISWVTYSEGKALLHIQKRHTGAKRKIVLGNYGDGDDGCNVVSISGQCSAAGVVNRWIGRGDKIIDERTTTSPTGEPITIKQDWDSNLNTAVLAKPQLVYSSKDYSAVGTRYYIENDEIDAATIMPILASYVNTQHSIYGTNRRDSRLELFYRESENSSNWIPYDGQWRLERSPDLSASIGGANLNKNARILLVFDQPQVYKKTATSETTFVGFREFRLTFAFRSKSVSEAFNYGRCSADSGRRGKFQYERKRLVLAPAYKYVKRYSYRQNYGTDGAYNSITLGGSTIKDDRFKLRDWMSSLADAHSEPVHAYRITLLGSKGPDFSWWPGQRITEIENATSMAGVNLDIVGVSFDLIGGTTTLYTEDVAAFAGRRT